MSPPARAAYHHRHQLWRQGLAAQVRDETEAITDALNQAVVKAQEARAQLDLAVSRMLALTTRLRDRL